jgi:asparagine synthase (glutamine-hydrolysing)
VVLSGIAGDDLGVSEIDVPMELADLAAAGDLRRLLRETRRWSTRLDLPLLSLAWSGIVLPFLPHRWQSRLTARDWQHIPWVRDDFARRTRLRRRLSAALPGEAERSLRRPSLRRRSAGLRATVSMQVQPRYLDAEVLGRETRYPYLHRPLVEFCLGLPLDQLVRPGETRSLHRRALAGVLPPQVARRSSKRGPEEAMIRAVGRHWRTLEQVFSADARIYQAGFVEKAPFLRALTDFRFGMLVASGPVFRALELEAWLRQDE